VQVASERAPVLLVAYDIPMPEPLHALRPLAAPCGVALLLAPPALSSAPLVAAVDLCLAAPDSSPDAVIETSLDDAELEAIRIGNPAARALPLLASIARQSTARVVLSYDAARQLALSVSTPR